MLRQPTATRISSAVQALLLWFHWKGSFLVPFYSSSCQDASQILKWVCKMILLRPTSTGLSAAESNGYREGMLLDGCRLEKVSLPDSLKSYTTTISTTREQGKKTWIAPEPPLLFHPMLPNQSFELPDHQGRPSRIPPKNTSTYV